MTRLKITWKWNGEKIREESTDESDLVYSDSANMPALKATSRKPGAGVVSNLPTWDLNAITKGVKRMRIEQARDGMVLFTNILYQSLGGEVGCG